MMKYCTIFLLMVYTATTSALPSCVCTRNLKPVCGSDGVTYSNECTLNCQATKTPGLTLQQLGSCDSDPAPNTCICTYEYKPVCASDGVTYPNKCAFECQNRLVGDLKVVSSGSCKIKREIPEDCICTFEYKPVCGSDGKTYPNRCALDCRSRSAHVEEISAGPCPEKPDFDSGNCICPMDYRPVCGSDGQSYPNRCALNCKSKTVKNLQMVSEDSCSNLRAKRDAVKVVNFPICKCTKEGNPVCGSDGKTYGNPCTLNCMKAVIENLHIEYTGRCKSDEYVPQLPKYGSSGCSCSRDLQPICASNGVTYTNVCLMSCADEGLTVVRDGPCED